MALNSRNWQRWQGTLNCYVGCKILTEKNDIHVLHKYHFDRVHKRDLVRDIDLVQTLKIGRHCLHVWKKLPYVLLKKALELDSERLFLNKLSSTVILAVPNPIIHNGITNFHIWY